MKYFVEYNGQCMAIYKSVKSCLNFINRKGWKNDENNMLSIIDEEGQEYDTVTGEMIEDECEDLPLNENEFNTLVDLMVDHNMDFELEPATSPNDHVVLKFENGRIYFRCLLKDYERAIDYINDPSLGEGF